MICCEKEPYWTNSNRYFRDTINHFEIAYWTWMMNEYKCVLLDKAGSYSDVRDQHWVFNDERDMTFFKLRWS